MNYSKTKNTDLGENSGSLYKNIDRNFVFCIMIKLLVSGIFIKFRIRSIYGICIHIYLKY